MGNDYREANWKIIRKQGQGATVKIIMTKHGTKALLYRSYKQRDGQWGKTEWLEERDLHTFLELLPEAIDAFRMMIERESPDLKAARKQREDNWKEAKETRDARQMSVPTVFSEDDDDIPF